jgi:predicted O-methyltransferase YrrM
MSRFDEPDYAVSFRLNLQNLKVKEKGKYLEIGIWEGRSATYMLDNYDIEYTGIDLYPNTNALSNLKEYRNKTIIFGDSRLVLPRLRGYWDIIYIDGCHEYDVVKEDIKNSWPLLEEGGILLLDDYGMDDVKKAVDEFIQTVDHEVILTNWQIAIRKN